MYRLVYEFSDQKWHNIEYGICGEYCIGVCNIFAWLGLVNIVESSCIFGGEIYWPRNGCSFGRWQNGIYRSEEAQRVSEKRHLEFYSVEDVRVQEKHGISREKDSKAKIMPKGLYKILR